MKKKLFIFIIIVSISVSLILIGNISKNQDIDGDGIANNIDLCPKTFGTLEKYGCAYRPYYAYSNQSFIKAVSSVINDVFFIESQPRYLYLEHGFTIDTSPGKVYYKGQFVGNDTYDISVIFPKSEEVIVEFSKSNEK